MFEPPEVKHDRLFLISVLGFIVNLIGVFVFQHGGGHGHSHGGDSHGHSHGGDSHGHSHGGDHGHSHGGGNAFVIQLPFKFLHALLPPTNADEVVLRCFHRRLSVHRDELPM